MKVEGSVTIFKDFAEWEEYFLQDPEYGGISPGPVAAALGVSRQRIWEMIGKGQIRATQIGPRRLSARAVTLIPDSEVARLLTTRKRGMQN